MPVGDPPGPAPGPIAVVARGCSAIRQDCHVIDGRLLFVHAHPDDETINNGATMARYVAEGAQVTLLTCTLGEEGEILVPELSQLAADQADQLGGYRISELADAMAARGVTHTR